MDIKTSTLEIVVGTNSKEDRLGDYYNSIDQITNFFLSQTNETNKDMAKILELYGEKITRLKINL